MRLSFSQKLWLPLILSLICLTGVSVYSAFQTRGTQLEERKENLIEATALAIRVVRSYADQAAAGQMPVAEARMQALERIRKMRYGADGYFVVFNRRDFMMNVESGFCCELLVRSW
jgi:methyl-accepting chemotaxis protein